MKRMGRMQIHLDAIAKGLFFPEGHHIIHAYQASDEIAKGTISIHVIGPKMPEVPENSPVPLVDNSVFFQDDEP